MEREAKAGILLAMGAVVLVLLFIGLVRYLVPMILEAHFAGSVLMASAVGLLGISGLAWLAVILFARFVRVFGKSNNDDKP